MTFDQMVKTIAILVGGKSTFLRLFPDVEEVQIVLDSAQKAVQADLDVALGGLNAPTMDPDQAMVPYWPSDLPTITSTTECQLPDVAHDAVCCWAARRLMRKSADRLPRSYDWTRLDHDYAEAINRAALSVRMALSSTGNPRITDAFAPDRHDDEEF